MAEKMKRKIAKPLCPSHYVDVFIVNSASLNVCQALDVASGRRAFAFLQILEICVCL